MKKEGEEKVKRMLPIQSSQGRSRGAAQKTAAAFPTSLGLGRRSIQSDSWVQVQIQPVGR